LNVPFINQHDVYIISNHEIYLFNNNSSSLDATSFTDEISDFNSNILIYNFEDSTYRTYFSKQLASEDIFSRTEGLHTILPSGEVFVESQNSGKIYIISEDGTVFRKYFHTSIDDMIELPHWIRIYETLKFK
jgi:hypothetical protein